MRVLCEGGGVICCIYWVGAGRLGRKCLYGLVG